MGIEFFQTGMGRTFYEGTMPALVKALERIAGALEASKEVAKLRSEVDGLLDLHGIDLDEAVPYVPVGELWADDKVQFARLLCELGAACEMPEIDQVAASMDLDGEQMGELWRRAEAVWKQSKAEHCPPHKEKEP